jgi:hypothetical protein
MKNAKSLENSDFARDINEIVIELSENFQRYINECCESESDGKIDGFDAGCCKCRGRGHYQVEDIKAGKWDKINGAAEEWARCVYITAFVRCGVNCVTCIRGKGDFIL